MHLTLHTDYSLRVLLYLKLRRDERSTIQEISEAYGISRNHLMKVVQRLAQLGYVDASRGRGGGLRLAMEPKQINIGRVVEQTEPNLDLVECFDMETNTCPIVPACELKSALGKAQQAFLETLRAYTLADLGTRRKRLLNLLTADAAPPAATRRRS